MGYSPWGCKESDTTEQLTHTHTHTHPVINHNGKEYEKEFMYLVYISESLCHPGELTQHCK